MAVFGAPLDQPDHALRACRTAHRDDVRAARGSGRNGRRRAGRMSTSASASTRGDMVVGNMGSQMRFDYTVMGDSVNLASRLEGTNKEYGTNIIISEFTYEISRTSSSAASWTPSGSRGRSSPSGSSNCWATRRTQPSGRSSSAASRRGWQNIARGSGTRRSPPSGASSRSSRRISPAKLYIDRCEALKEYPPEGEWDGVFTMTKK